MILDKPLRVQRLTASAVLPKYQSAGAAALDLHADEEWVLFPGERARIPTNIAVEIPVGYEGQVRGRSGLTSKGHEVKLGTIDSDYRGGIGVICVNELRALSLRCANCGEYQSDHFRPRGVSCTTYTDDSAWVISPGNRIAQLVIAPVARVSIQVANDLSPTERGDGGFGSTGR